MVWFNSSRISCWSDAASVDQTSFGGVDTTRTPSRVKETHEPRQGIV